MTHLSDERLTEWLAGEASPETETHLAECPQCHGEAVAIRDNISRYALAVRGKAAGALKAQMDGVFAPQKTLARHRLRWAGAGVLAVLLAAQTIWMTTWHTAARPAPPTASSQKGSPIPAMSDDELLEAVHNDLNRDVPQALARVSAITVARNEIAAASTSAAINRNTSK